MKKFKLEIERIKELSNLDLSVRENQKEVLSLIENLCSIIIAQNERIQELEDEINRLKGEKGKPKFTKRPASKSQALREENLQEK